MFRNIHLFPGLLVRFGQTDKTNTKGPTPCKESYHITADLLIKEATHDLDTHPVIKAEDDASAYCTCLQFVTTIDKINSQSTASE